MAASTEKPRGRLGNLWVVWRAAGKYPAQIFAALFFLVMSSAATLAIPYGFKRVIDQGFGSQGGSEHAVATAFHYLLMIVAVLALATALRFYFVSWIGERTVADLRVAVQRNLLSLPPRFFEENRPSEIASRLTADTAILDQVIGSSVSIALRNMATGIGGIIYLFVLAPKLAAMLVIGIPVIVIPLVLFGRQVRSLSRSSQDRIADVGTTVSETLGAMKVVQAFGQEERELGRFSTAVEQAFRVARRRFTLRAVMTFSVILMMFGAIVMILWEGASDVAEGRMTGGTIAAFVFTGVLVGGAFGALTETYGDLLRGSGAAGRIHELLIARPEIHAPAEPVALPEPPVGSLEFDNITFRYPTRPEEKAVHDLSLNIARGETVAVVGPSGAGKSTLLQLALRFYDPQEGRVLIDGIDVRDVDPAEMRKRIALVPQETVIFAASAKDNIRYGRWDSTDEEIVEAAKAANAHEFLDTLPERYDTFLGEGGARLSGGQRQRIVIARALLRDAPLLLLDEATSALDAHSEQLVQEALERLMKTRTTVVIAHRLATTRAADRIIVMEHGRIVEEGTHDSLTKAKGLYASLARLQFAGQAA
ncbi:ABC transporter transmembrane domain-containing protein [Sphingomonas sp. RG327]|uniref:ABC transporter transmembrane domain-containing protein n=1 Tax=Sphingomonas anseongensis TaxID=2908207 RepID=A0ABT0RDL4_9SPHN|nr:ABC transporter transmembrane domain-containing protein [Sphingomonas anseongensis]MCL6678333.1 ABC transporter transmembrane domain-containing protein [Sphingomonas anseongensis]